MWTSIERDWKKLLLDGRTVCASLRIGGKAEPIYPERLSAMEDGKLGGQLESGVSVFLERRVHEDVGGASWLLRMRNDAVSDSPEITNQYGMDLTLPVEDDVRLETLLGDDNNGNSFLPRTEALKDGCALVFEPSGGRPSSYSAFPWFDLISGGQVLTFGIGWTGQWKLTVLRDGDCVRLCVSIADADFYLHPGETARTPRVIVMADRADPNDNRRAFRRLLLEEYSPSANRTTPVLSPLAVQNFDLYCPSLPAWCTEPMQLKEIQDAANCGGFDTYWLDAAWFRDGFPNGVGNYTFDKGFPNGVRPLSDLAHERNLKFMLWFEPARVYEGSDLFANHPEFLLYDPDFWDLKTRLFDFSNPTAWKWLCDTLCGFIEQNCIDIYREDYNISPLGFWRYADEPGRAGLTEIRWVEGMYALWDAILDRFPGILIDNCAGGGRRLDFECTCRSISCWRSDTGCNPPSEERPTDLWNQNQALGLSRYLPYHATSSWRSEAYYVRAAMTTGMTMAVPFEDDNFDLSPTRRALDEVNRLREYWLGDFYPLTEATLRSDVWCAYQLVLPDGRGCAYAFRRPDCTECAFPLYLNRIDPEDDYRVTVTDEQYSAHPSFRCLGADLQKLVVEADPHESVVVTYEKWIDRD